MSLAQVGHNFGASHSFEQGRGCTGGITNYGPDLLNNICQFNTQFPKSEVCGEIQSNINCQYFSSYAPECGNGVVEQGEECECPSGTDCTCCKQCELNRDKNARCTEGECCDTDCQFKNVTTQCGGGTKICNAGSCVATSCEEQVLMRETRDTRLLATNPITPRSRAAPHSN